MPHYRLPDHLGICEVDGRVLILDLRRDRYLALDARSADTMRRWRDGRVPPDGDPGISRLLDCGMLLLTAVPQQDPWRTCPVPGRSLLDVAAPASQSPFRDLTDAAASLWRARAWLRRCGLEQAVRECRPSQPDGTGDPVPHVASFRAARRLLPLAPNCLTDSLALATFLAGRRVASALVFGVKLDPFAAHCWLQQDDVILNDAADRVTTFTPIMRV
jgi:hypothetical protein